MAIALVERYDDGIAGVLSWYDRVAVTGTLPTDCYAEVMTRFPYANQIRIFDYPAFASTLRDRVREAATSRWLLKAGSRSNLSPRAISARKRSSPKCWNSGAIIPAYRLAPTRVDRLR